MEYEKTTRQAGGEVLRAGDAGGGHCGAETGKAALLASSPGGSPPWESRCRGREAGGGRAPGLARVSLPPLLSPSLSSAPQCLCLKSLRPLPPVGLMQQLQAFSQTLRFYD